MLSCRPLGTRSAPAVLLAVAVVLASGVDSRNNLDLCFSCMNQPICASAEAQPGALFTLEVPPGTPNSKPAPPSIAAAYQFLNELAVQRRVFTLRYRQQAFLEVDGKQLLLGSFVEDQSNESVHVFQLPEDSSTPTQLHLKAVVELRCNERAVEERLVKVAASIDGEAEAQAAGGGGAPPLGITFTFIMPSLRACGLPPCATEGEPVTAGEYFIYRPPLVRQDCPGTFLSAPTCQSGASELLLSGRQRSRQRWHIAPPAPTTPEAAAAAAAGDGIEDDLVGRAVVIQNVGRSARQCASHLGAAGVQGCAASAAASAIAVEAGAEEWVIETGPLGQAGVLVTQYYLRSKRLSDAGCPRAYLCISLACDAPQLRLCTKGEEGHATLWNVRPADISATLARVWGLS